MAIADITIVTSAVATAVTAIFAIGQKMYEQHSKNKQQKFENYHGLIKQINAPYEGDEHPYMQVQQAALFELRNYKEYKGVSRYILQRWARNDSYREVSISTLEALGFEEGSDE